MCTFLYFCISYFVMPIQTAEADDTFDNPYLVSMVNALPTAPMLTIYSVFCFNILYLYLYLYFVFVFVFCIQAAWYLISMVNALPTAPTVTIYFHLKPKSFARIHQRTSMKPRQVVLNA